MAVSTTVRYEHQEAEAECSLEAEALTESDIGKILELAELSIHHLSRDMKLTLEDRVTHVLVHMNQGLFVNFNLHGKSDIPGFTIVSILMEYFAMHACFLHLIRWADRPQVSLLRSRSDRG